LKNRVKKQKMHQKVTTSVVKQQMAVVQWQYLVPLERGIQDGSNGTKFIVKKPVLKKIRQF
jgi:hypothetical protein